MLFGLYHARQEQDKLFLKKQSSSTNVNAKMMSITFQTVATDFEGGGGRWRRHTKQDKAIFLSVQVYPVLQVDADASNLSFGSVLQDDADTSNISFRFYMRTPRVCDRVVDRLRWLLLRLKSEKSCIDNSSQRSFFVLLVAVLCEHVIRHTAESYLWTSSPARVFLVRVLFTKIYRSDLAWIGLFVCRTDRSRVEPVRSHHQHL